MELRNEIILLFRGNNFPKFALESDIKESGLSLRTFLLRYYSLIVSPVSLSTTSTSGLSVAITLRRVLTSDDDHEPRIEELFIGCGI